MSFRDGKSGDADCRRSGVFIRKLGVPVVYFDSIIAFDENNVFSRFLTFIFVSGGECYPLDILHCFFYLA